MPFSTANLQSVVGPSVVAFDSTGTKETFRFVVPVLIHRLVALVTVVLTGPTCVFTLDHVVGGPDQLGTALTPSGGDAVGDFTVAALSAVGTGAFKDAESFTAGRPLLVLPGEQVEFNIVGGGATSGDGYVGLEYQPLPMVAANFVRLDADNISVPVTAPRADTTYLGNLVESVT